MRKILLNLVLLFVFLFAQIVYAKELTIIYTNDIHGNLMPFQYTKYQPLYGGMSRHGTFIKNIREAKKNVLLLDAGDRFQGTIYFNLLDGIEGMKIMNILKYDAMQLGNHDFDKGLEVVNKLVDLADFPILSSNLRFKDKKLNKKIKPYIIKDYDGLKVAIIGVCTPNLYNLVADFKDVEILNTYKTTQNLVNKLKPDVDLVIVLSHSGYKPDINLAKNVYGIDIIIGGHSHTLLKKPSIVKNHKNNTLVLQSGEFGINIGQIDLNIENKKIKSYQFKSNKITMDYPEDIEISKKLEVLNKKINSISEEIVGYTKTGLDGRSFQLKTSQTNLGALITNSIKAKVPYVDMVILNSGGIRFFSYKKAGNIKNKEIHKMCSFPNTIVTAKLNGKEIKSILELNAKSLPKKDDAYLQVLGVTYDIDTDKTPTIILKDKTIVDGNRIKNIKINGKSLINEKYYTIATNNFVFNGGNFYTQFKNSKDINKTDILIRKAVYDYVKANSPLEF